MIETQERESELKKLNEVNKKKLLDDLAQEENKKEAEIMKIQKLRDNERKILNDRMMQAEQQSDVLIKELMESHSNFSDPSKVMEALEEDKRKMEAQLTVVKEDAEKLREKDVLRKLLTLILAGRCCNSPCCRCHADDDGRGDAEESHDEVLRGPPVCHTERHHEVKKKLYLFC